MMGKVTRGAALCSESPIDPSESETLNMRGHSMHENREIPWTGLSMWQCQVRVVNLRSTMAMNGCGKSDSPIVPVKPSNKCFSALQCAKRVEERGLAKGYLSGANK